MKNALICFLAASSLGATAWATDYSEACAEYRLGAEHIMTQRQEGATFYEVTVPALYAVEDQAKGDWKLAQRASSSIMNIAEKAYKIPVYESSNERLSAIAKFGVEIESICNKDITELLIYEADFGLKSKAKN